jgi:hypothetical protein
MATKHEILLKTGATSDQYDKAFRKFFGSEMRAGSGSANLDRPIPADSYKPYRIKTSN